jgi:dTMP kinase
MTSKEGRIIAIDGPDGVGKTTQIQLTAKFLQEQGQDVHVTRASGGTPIGEAIRKVSLSPIERLPEVDAYLSLAMHTELGHDLQKRKAAGQVCLVDRSPMAVLAYNVYGGLPEDESIGRGAFESMMQLWHPDLIIVLNAAQQLIDVRRHLRSAKPLDYFEQQDSGYHARVRDGYESAVGILREHPDWYGQLALVDGAPDTATVQASIRQVVNKVL